MGANVLDHPMDIPPIKSQRDYRRVLKEIEGLMSARRNTPEGDRLDVLVTLVEAWERKHYPLDLPDPVEAIRYHMEQSGLQPRDLIPFIGSRNRVHEVLNRHGASLPCSGTRAPTVRMVSSSSGEGPGPLISRGFTERRVFRKSMVSGTAFFLRNDATA